MEGRKRGSRSAGVPARGNPWFITGSSALPAAPIIKARTAEGGGSTNSIPDYETLAKGLGG